MRKLGTLFLLLACLTSSAYAGPEIFFGVNHVTAPVLQQNLGASPDDYITFGDASADKYLAQAFTASSSYTLTQLGVGMQIGSGAPLASAVTAYIYSDSGGSGPSTLLGTSTNTISNTLAGSNTNYLFQFTGVSLSNGVKYWVVTSLATVSGTNYPAWNLSSAGTNTDGSYKSANGSSWSVDYSGTWQGTIQTYH